MLLDYQFSGELYMPDMSRFVFKSDTFVGRYFVALVRTG